MAPRQIFLIRHGETEWSLSGQHTGTTDIPLTKKGEKEAHLLGKRLKTYSFEHVLTSPLRRAQQTCEIADLSQQAEIDPDLAEWNYGAYEGLTTSEIWKTEPDWNIFLKGAPGGESLAAISSRIHRVLERLTECKGDIAIFSHGHFLRALATRWLNLPIREGKGLLLSPASLSILGFERQNPVLALWNDVSHLI
jgi:broad specificity phosphatase PhoE